MFFIYCGRVKLWEEEVDIIVGEFKVKNVFVVLKSECMLYFFRGVKYENLLKILIFLGNI